MKIDPPELSPSHCIMTGMAYGIIIVSILWVSMGYLPQFIKDLAI